MMHTNDAGKHRQLKKIYCYIVSVYPKTIDFIAFPLSVLL